MPSNATCRYKKTLAAINYCFFQNFISILYSITATHRSTRLQDYEWYTPNVLWGKKYYCTGIYKNHIRTFIGDIVLRALGEECACFIFLSFGIFSNLICHIIMNPIRCILILLYRRGFFLATTSLQLILFIHLSP